MIHPTAIVEPGAEIHASAEIGPYCTIGPHVRIGSGTWVGPHVVIGGRTEIGENNRIFQFASIGEIPQHMKYRGEPTELKIGSGNVFREFVTIHLGTVQDRGITSIGNRNVFMAYCHVAHDCTIEDSVIMSNGATLAGHVLVERSAILGGLVGVHQFVRIGRFAMVAALSGVSLDIPPYTSAAGFRTRLYGLNLVGLRRNGFAPEQLRRLRKAYRTLFQSGLLLEGAIDQVTGDLGNDPDVAHLLDFLKGSRRGICR
ncbi:MAG: acyl-ACP--UDP-N-acetylglucosamine O-acyltransferase [bacterium]